MISVVRGEDPRGDHRRVARSDGDEIVDEDDPGHDQIGRRPVVDSVEDEVQHRAAQLGSQRCPSVRVVTKGSRGAPQ
jgi:hypothetical protein